MGCEAIGKRQTGMQEKPDDRFVVPLCAYHHRTGILSQHNVGEEQFWRDAGLNPFATAMRLFAASGGPDRASEQSPPKIKRPGTVRKPRELRRRVSQGRPLAGTVASGIKRKFDGTVERRA